MAGAPPILPPFLPNPLPFSPLSLFISDMLISNVKSFFFFPCNTLFNFFSIFSFGKIILFVAFSVRQKKKNYIICMIISQIRDFLFLFLCHHKMNLSSLAGVIFAQASTSKSVIFVSMDVVHDGKWMAKLKHFLTLIRFPVQSPKIINAVYIIKSLLTSLDNKSLNIARLTFLIINSR